VSSSLYTSQIPSLPDVSEGSPVTVGITLTFSVAGQVSGARVYAPATIGAGTYEAAFWRVTTDDNAGSGAGTLLANAVFGALTPGTWNNVAFSSPVTVDTTHAYVIGLRTSQGRYAATGGLFGAAIVNAPITGVQDGSAFPAGGFAKLFNGRFTSGLVNYPNSTFGSNGYFVDVLFDPSGADVLLAATLTATGSLTAGLTSEAQLGAALAATGSLTAGLTSEARMAATLTATGSMAAALTTPTGPVDPIASPVAAELLACFTEQLQQLPSPPRYIQMRVGQDTGPLIGPNVDECCSGLAWVRIAGVRPSWDSFPATDNTWTPCGPLAYAVDLEMGVAFCMPWSDSEGSFEDIDPPSAQDWATAAATQMQHQTLMRRTAACCFRPTQRRAVGEWSPLPVEGGCTGGKLTVTVSVMAPCSDC
jgi:hypothetical protein